MPTTRQIAAYFLVVGVAVLLTLQLSSSLHQTEDRARQAEQSIVLKDREIERLRTLPGRVEVVVRERVNVAGQRTAANTDRASYIPPRTIKPASPPAQAKRPTADVPIHVRPTAPATGLVPSAPVVPAAPTPTPVHVPVDPGLEDSTPKGPINQLVCFVLSQVSDACA